MNGDHERIFVLFSKKIQYLLKISISSATFKKAVYIFFLRNLCIVKSVNPSSQQ